MSLSPILGNMLKTCRRLAQGYTFSRTWFKRNAFLVSHSRFTLANILFLSTTATQTNTFIQDHHLMKGPWRRWKFVAQANLIGFCVGNFSFTYRLFMFVWQVEKQTGKSSLRGLTTQPNPKLKLALDCTTTFGHLFEALKLICVPHSLIWCLVGLCIAKFVHQELNPLFILLLIFHQPAIPFHFSLL